MLRPLLLASPCSPSPHVGDRFVSEGEKTHQKRGRRRPSATPALDDDCEGLIVGEGVSQVAVVHVLRPLQLQTEVASLVVERIGTAHDATLRLRGQRCRPNRQVIRQPTTS
jgi:hypothetical protein